jgi:glycosyltransferase involved in cell wall biosynthesis
MPAEEPAVGHVLMTADTVGGVWTYALELAGALARFGTRTTIATMGEPLRPEQARACAEVPGLQVLTSAFRLEWMDEPWADVSAAGDWLLGVEERDRPDVVHLNGYVHAALPWRAPKLVVAHSCVLSWWEAVFGAPAPDAYDVYRHEVGRGLRAADAIVAPTAAMLDALRATHGLARSGVVIPNGVDPGALFERPKEPIVLAAGRMWDRAKNLAAIEAAAPDVRWPVYVAGSRGAPAAAPRPSVRFLGRLPPAELRVWMARAAVYAAPARYEPFGLSVLEAALSGCALVLGDIPSLREVWEGAALFVHPDDVRGLAGAVDHLAADGELLASLSSAARVRAFSYGSERMARSYLDLYERLLLAGAERTCVETPCA